MASERLRAFARDYASRPAVAHVAHDPQPMGNTDAGRKAQLIQSVVDGVAHVAHVARENGNAVGDERNAPTERDPAACLLLMLWPLGVTVEAAPDGALVITPHPSGKRIPGALRAAVRRHRAALAEWVTGNPDAPLRWVAGDGGKL